MSAWAAAVWMTVALFLSAAAPAQDTAVPKIDYADAANWLCRPGSATDACAQSDERATVIEADGTLHLEDFHATAAAPIDCFYVYPTVSLDPAANAPVRVDGQLKSVVKQQFARFASVCRTFAPIYRQVTLTALRAALSGHPMNVDRAVAYNDVKDAWDYYLAHDNHGRGVALIGHSQGSLVLTQLVKQEIDGKPVQQRLLSVMLAGARLQVPVGKAVGGDFQSIPLCRSARQLACAVSFASFRETRPPPASAQLFGASAGAGLEAACVNPAALAGGSGALDAYLASGIDPEIVDSMPPDSWTQPPQKITTPFVQVPGLLSAECRSTGTHHYLAISIHPSPGARTNQITGDVVVKGEPLKAWGLHIIDVNLTIGNLIDLVRQEGQAYLAREAH